MSFLQKDWSIKHLVALLLLSLVAAGFELHPLIYIHRIVVPESVYVGQACDCQCILNARAWYSRFNYWFWLFVFSVPLAVFAIRPGASAWKRGLGTVLIIAFGYWLANLATSLGHEIRNGPFAVYDDVPFQKTMDMAGCSGGSGMGARSFVFLFGWVYAVLYAGWWKMLWHVYHQRKTQLIDATFKHDVMSKVVIALSVLVPVLVCLWLLGGVLLHDDH